jgi:hypothetical protein
MDSEAVNYDPIAQIPDNDSCEYLECGDYDCECQGYTQGSGDINGDTLTNILDIVELINMILSGEEFSYCEKYVLDITGDQEVNILDVIRLVSVVLGTDDVPTPSIIEEVMYVNSPSGMVWHTGGYSYWYALDTPARIILMEDYLLNEEGVYDNGNDEMEHRSTSWAVGKCYIVRPNQTSEFDNFLRVSNQIGHLPGGVDNLYKLNMYDAYPITGPNKQRTDDIFWSNTCWNHVNVDLNCSDYQPGGPGYNAWGFYLGTTQDVEPTQYYQGEAPMDLYYFYNPFHIEPQEIYRASDPVTWEALMNDPYSQTTDQEVVIAHFLHNSSVMEFYQQQLETVNWVEISGFPYTIPEMCLFEKWPEQSISNGAPSEPFPICESYEDAQLLGSDWCFNHIYNGRMGLTKHSITSLVATSTEGNFNQEASELERSLENLYGGNDA